jgi:hypothetical protein
VNAEELFVHYRRQWQSAEGVHASLINPLGVFPFTFEFKGKIICQMATFVIATKKKEGIWVPHFQRPKVQDTLDTEVPSVYVVAQEEIICFGGESAVLEQSQEIVVLAMNVAADLVSRNVNVGNERGPGFTYLDWGF